MSKEWESVAENTSRLEVSGGHLYRVGEQLAFVPSAIASDLADISESLGTLADAADEIRTLFDDVTLSIRGSFGHSGRAIRVSDIGD